MELNDDEVREIANNMVKAFSIPLIILGISIALSWDQSRRDKKEKENQPQRTNWAIGLNPSIDAQHIKEYDPTTHKVKYRDYGPESPSNVEKSNRVNQSNITLNIGDGDIILENIDKDLILDQMDELDFWDYYEKYNGN